MTNVKKVVSFFVILNQFTVSKGNTHCSGSGNFQKSDPDPVKAGPEVQCNTEKKTQQKTRFYTSINVARPHQGFFGGFGAG